MAANLTPEQLAALQKALSSGAGAYLGYVMGPDGRIYQSADSRGQGQDNVGATSGNGYAAYDPNKTSTSDTFDRYNNGGEYGGSTNFNNQVLPGKEFWTAAAMMAPGFAAGVFPGVNSALSGMFGNGVGTAADAGTGYADMWSGMPAGTVEGSYGGAAGAGGVAGGGGGAASGALQGSSAGMTAPAGMGSTAGLTAGGMTPGLQAAIDAAGGAGGLSKFLGPAAAIIGAVAGSQPQTKTDTTTKTMDPRLDPAVYGPGGLVERTQGLLAQQMTPERMAGYGQMRNAGMGLLQQPIAGNGFAGFLNRR